MSLSEILNAIRRLTGPERLWLVAQLERDLAQEHIEEMPKQDDPFLEERGRLLVYTGPVNVSTLDHRAARAERIYNLVARSRAHRD